VVKEVVWKKLVTLQAVTTPTQLPGLTVCGAPAPEPAPAVVTKEYEWSLGGITEDTYVTFFDVQTLMEQLADSVITTEP
jgi:hypothetical protein